MLRVFKGLAFSQLHEVVAQEVYNGMNYDNPGLRPREISKKDYPEISDVLFTRLAALKSQVSGLTEDEWKHEFLENCKIKHAALESQWESEWLTLCDGKRFFRDLHQEYGVKASPLKFKKMIVERMQIEKADSWVLVNQLLSDALKAT